jgi:putative tryptophan/tyrosine transport system substrate-binding protein
MRRREFITLLGGAATWPLAASAQQQERMRRLGVLAALGEDDPDMQARLAGLRQGLERLGWSEGRNVCIDTRFAGGSGDRHQPLAKELVALQPDVIFAQSTPIAAALQRESPSIPIIFVEVSDPIGSGFIANLARPGGNLTGLLAFEASITGKWLAMLKEVAPRLARAALLANPKTTSYDYFLRSAGGLAPSLAVVVPSRIENAADIERTIAAFAQVPDGGLVLPPDGTTLLHRDLIIDLAKRHRLPGTYPVEVFRQTAAYVDRILRGAKPADLPVQAPTKYQTVINLKTAKALGLEVPPALLVAADEVIE